MDSKVLCKAGIVIAALGILAACGRGPVAAPGLAVSHPVVEAGQAGYSSNIEGRYLLRANDVISVTVFREDDLSIASIPISVDGQVSLPLVGPFQIAGLTTNQAEQDIAKILNARYLRDGEVSINILEYKSHVLTVEGAVEEPGLFQFRPGTRLSGGIALAAGTTRVAAKNDIAVFRQSPDGIQIAKFDYGAVQAGTMLDPVLQPGDRIVVGVSSLSQYWQDTLQALPLFALFTRL